MFNRKERTPRLLSVEKDFPEQLQLSYVHGFELSWLRCKRVTKSSSVQEDQGHIPALKQRGALFRLPQVNQSQRFPEAMKV